MLTKHVFNSDGSFYGRASVGSLELPEGAIVIENLVEEYPYPVKLEEGVIVQDGDKKPFKGRWRSSKEVEAMKVKEKKNSGVATREL